MLTFSFEGQLDVAALTLCRISRSNPYRRFADTPGAVLVMTSWLIVIFGDAGSELAGTPGSGREIGGSQVFEEPPAGPM
jgi:hypothetical protein